MGSKSAVSIFSVPKCAVGHVILLQLVYILWIFCFIYMIKCEDSIALTICGIVGIVEMLWAILWATSSMIYRISFYSDKVIVNHYFFYFKREIALKYDEIKYFVCYTELKTISFHRKGFLKIPIGGNYNNKHWKAEQLQEICRILNEHKVKIKL